MISLETDLAIYKRLTGYPLDAKGRPALDEKTGIPINREVIGPPDLNLVEHTYDPNTDTLTPLLPRLPSYGIRLPSRKAGFTGLRGLTSNDPAAYRPFEAGYEPNNFVQVPVFDQNTSGRKWDDVWPCVTFRWMGLEPDPAVSVYHDPFGGPDPTSLPVQIKNDQGVVVASGFDQVTIRPHPEGWLLLYAITARAKNQTDLALIETQIMQLFPARGAINVTFMDGSTHACDMLLRRVVTLDDGQDNVLLTHGPEEQRDFARAFIYVVEGYMDNTANKFGVQGTQWATRNAPAIIERIMEIGKLMDGVVSDLQTEDLNSKELNAFTA